LTDTPALRQSRLALAEAQRNVWFATVEQHVTPEDVLRPEFWLHIAHQVRPYDEIVVATDSCAWRMEVLVCDVWHHGARVVEMNRVDMTGEEHEDKSVGDDLLVKWRGPHSQWCVVRNDGVILRGGLDNKNTALETLAAIAQERAAIGN
jgi:hypothetical protein